MLAALYDGAAFCVYPSMYEGYGLPIVEAFARGKAVIASNRGSIPEIAAAFAPCLDPTDEEAWLERGAAMDRRSRRAPRLRGQDPRRVSAGVVGGGGAAVLSRGARDGRRFLSWRFGAVSKPQREPEGWRRRTGFAIQLDTPRERDNG